MLTTRFNSQFDFWKYILISFIAIQVACKSQETLIYKDLETAIQDGKKATVLKLRNSNRYTSFPLEIYGLTKLKELSFIGSDCDIRNQKCINIKKLPDGIQKLANLEKLYLVMNTIKTVSDEINGLSKLKVLDLSDNTNINLDNLKNESIEILNLNGCYLTTLPKNLHTMKHLKALGLEGNLIAEDQIDELQSKLPNCKISR